MLHTSQAFTWQQQSPRYVRVLAAGLLANHWPNVLQGIMAAADDVIAAIDQVGLAVYLAQKCPEEGPGAAKRKKGAVSFPFFVVRMSPLVCCGLV